MGSKIQTSRIVAFGLVILILLALCVGTLYQLQIVDGAQALAESRAHQFSNQTVTAARGNILDRYGRVLVSNRECYNLYINTTRLFGDDVEDPNALILQMVNIVEANGIEWTDDLPITKEPPFEYDENMSALSRRMLEAYFERHGLDEDTSSVELMSYFRTRYEIANSYSSSDMRKISAVRYALNVRYAINTGDYIFVEDASIDLISELMGVVGQVVDHGLGLFGADVVGAVHGHGLGVAVHAFQVAALGHVPDHHGLLVLGELEQVRGQVAGFTAVTQGVGGLHLTAIQFGNTDHRTILYSESPFVPRRDSGHGAGGMARGSPEERPA